MNLLVCGGAGFIGSNFILASLRRHQDRRIVNYDCLTYAANLENLSAVENDPRYTFVRGNITDIALLRSVAEKHRITHIINFAAETHVDRSIHVSCRDFVLTNTLGVQMLLDLVREKSISRMINVSTDEVYGSLPLESDDAFTEDSPIAPNMPYAAAKAGGDLMCRAYVATHRVPVIVTHCSNNYGPYQFPEKLIPFFVCKLLNGEKVPVYGDGKNVRDWIHVEDHCEALDMLLEKGKDGEVYNIGADNERSNIELTRMILALMKRSEESIEYVTDRPGHDRRYAIDPRKMESLGWKPKYHAKNFLEGLQDTIEWYRSNSAWVHNIITKKEHEMNAFQQSLKRSSDMMMVSQTL